MASYLSRRQEDGSNGSYFSDSSNQTIDGGSDDAGSYTDKGDVIRYVIVGVLIFLILFWVFFGMWHANRRAKKGLPPLFYHRWLVPGRRRYHAGYPRQQAWPQHGFHGTPYQAPNNQAPGHQYPLQNWTYAPPPPVYSHDAPPNYQPPDGPPPGHDTKGGSGPAVTTMPVAGESATHHRS